MKNLILPIVLFVLSQQLISQAISPNSYSQLPSDHKGYDGIEKDVDARPIPQAGVDFYVDKSAWEAACSASESLSLTSVTEDFQNTLVPPNSVVTCGTILNDTTNDACYTPGSVVSGFTLDAFGGNLVVLGDEFFGPSIPAMVGPNSFDDNFNITFSVPVNAGCIEYREGIMPPGAIFDVELFGASGSLGLFGGTSNGIDAATVCFIASENVESITVLDFGAGGLLSELTFGQCEEIEIVDAIPTMGEWGLMCLGLLFKILGVVSVRQKVTVLEA